MNWVKLRNQSTLIRGQTKLECYRCPKNPTATGKTSGSSNSTKKFKLRQAEDGAAFSADTCKGPLEGVIETINSSCWYVEGSVMGNETSFFFL